jgi:hypothetical protein
MVDLNAADSPDGSRIVLPESQRDVQRVFLMLAVLHRYGYERLRVLPGMSPSGMHYRCSITPARNVYADHGAIGINDTLIARHTSANGRRYFEWDDVEDASPETLAGLFVERYARIAKLGWGADAAYAAWFREALQFVERGAFPVAYDDGYFAQENPRPGLIWLPTTGGQPSGLRMPPPGRSRKTLFARELKA